MDAPEALRTAMPAIPAILATGRINTGSAPLRPRCDFCDFATREWGQDEAATFATDRIKPSESQKSQQGLQAIERRRTSRLAVAGQSQKSQCSRNAGSRIKPSGSQESQESQGVSHPNCPLRKRPSDKDYP